MVQPSGSSSDVHWRWSRSKLARRYCYRFFWLEHDLSLKHALVLDFDCCQPDLAGYSNKFLLEFKDPIVAEYGDVSPNETMHAKITTSLIKQYGLLPSHLSEPVCSAVTDTIVFTDMAVSISSLTALAHIAVFAGHRRCSVNRLSSPKGKRIVLGMYRKFDSAIVNTMSLYCCCSQRHSELVRQFDGFVKQYGADVSCWPAGKARTCCMRMILHMADIGNVAKPTSMAIPWAKGMSKGELVRTGTVVWLSAQEVRMYPAVTAKVVPQKHQYCSLHWPRTVCRDYIQCN